MLGGERTMSWHRALCREVWENSQKVMGPVLEAGEILNFPVGITGGFAAGEPAR